MNRSSVACIAVGLLVVVLASASSVRAAVFASEVISYEPGSGLPVEFGSGEPYDIAESALGSPDDITGESGPTVLPNVLSPFSAAFNRDEIVSIGEGGHLTLGLPNFAVAGAGPEIGVVTNVNLFDSDYPSGVNTDPAAAFGIDDALVEVSADGTDFIALNGGNSLTFDMPANFYTNADPFDQEPPDSPAFADFGKPNPVTDFSQFDGTNHAEVLDLLEGSGGGTWLDLDGTGLDRIAFIRFSVLDDGDAETSLNFDLDAVSLANDAVGTPVQTVIPEPATLTMFGGLAALAMMRRRRRTGDA